MPARPCLQWFIFIIIGWPKKNIAEVQSWLDNTQCESTNFEWKERESPPVGVREEAKMLRALTGFLTWGKTFKMFLSIGNPGLIVDYHEYKSYLWYNDFTSRHSMRSNFPSSRFWRFSKGWRTHLTPFRPFAYKFDMFVWKTQNHFWCVYFSPSLRHIQCCFAEVKVDHLNQIKRHLMF